MMDRLTPEVVEKIERRAWRAARQLEGGEIRLTLFDCTTVYFESMAEDELRRKGYSKDGKPHRVQVLLGLLSKQQRWVVAGLANLSGVDLGRRCAGRCSGEDSPRTRSAARGSCGRCWNGHGGQPQSSGFVRIAVCAGGAAEVAKQVGSKADAGSEPISQIRRPAVRTRLLLAGNPAARRAAAGGSLLAQTCSQGCLRPRAGRRQARPEGATVVSLVAAAHSGSFRHLLHGTLLRAPP